MPDRLKAVVYLQPGSVPQRRQAAFCLEYCEEHGCRIVGVVPPDRPLDAVQMVADRQADLVVTAFAARARGGGIRELAEAAGVQLVYVRPPTVRREVGDMIVRMYRRSGGDVDLVAELVGESPEEIRALLARLGVVVPKPRNGSPPTSRERGGRRHNSEGSGP